MVKRQARVLGALQTLFEFEFEFAWGRVCFWFNEMVSEKVIEECNEVDVAIVLNPGWKGLDSVSALHMTASGK